MHPPILDPDREVEWNGQGRYAIPIQEPGKTFSRIIQFPGNPQHYPGLFSWCHPVGLDGDLLSEHDYRSG